MGKEKKPGSIYSSIYIVQQTYSYRSLYWQFTWRQEHAHISSPVSNLKIVDSYIPLWVPTSKH